MTEPFILPLHVSRGVFLRRFAPIMLVVEIMAAAILWYVLQGEKIAAVLRYLIPGFLAASGFFTPLILLVAMKPANITINRTSLDVAPISIFGFGGGPSVNCSITEFDRLEIEKITTKGNNAVYKIAFRAKDGKKDVIFDPPAKTDIHDYIARLGLTLNMKVIDNA